MKQLAAGVALERTSLVVLNLDGPQSVARVGGILGEMFLNRYEVSIDLHHHEVGLRTNGP